MLEIIHQAGPLVHFPTHVDRRLADCQGYQGLSGFQTYSQPVTKALIGHVTRKQTAPQLLLWKAKIILKTEAKRLSFLQVSWPNKVETYKMEKDLPLPRVKHYHRISFLVKWVKLNSVLFSFKHFLAY